MRFAELSAKPEIANSRGACRDQSVKISRIRERLKAEAKKPLVIPAPSAPRQRTAEDMCKDEEMWAGIRRAKAARLARR